METRDFLRELQIDVDINDVTLPEKSSKLGLYLFGLTGGIATAITVVAVPFLTPAFRRICLPYIPATDLQIKNILKALDNKAGTLIDLGSGDGRVVLAAAKAGFQSDGVELNPWLIRYSKFAALRQGLSSKVKFYKKDLWKFNLQNYNNVVIFGVEEMMYELEEKFKSELKPNSSIVVCRFPLPRCRPIATVGDGLDCVWVYETPLKFA